MLSTKKILLALINIPIFLNATEYQLSTHILDINSGQPASNVKVELYNLDQNRQWVKISEKFTKKNGRIADFLPYEKQKIVLLEFINSNFIPKIIIYHIKLIVFTPL